MKRLLMTLAGIALLTACHNENLPQNEAMEQAATLVTVTATLPQNEATGRVALTPDTNPDGAPVVKVDWRTGGEKETFSVMTAAAAATIFTQTEGTDFTGTLPAAAAGEPYYAFYPVADGATPTAVPYDLSQQTGRLDETKTYMYATSTDGTHFAFRHLTAIVKFRFHGLPDGVSLTSFTLQGNELTAKGTVDLTADGNTVTYNADDPPTNRVSITPQQGEDIYVYLPPMTEASMLQFVVNADNGKTYQSTISTAKDIVAGKIYTANVDLFEVPQTDASSKTAEDLKTHVTQALQDGSRVFHLTGELDENQQKAIGTALRDWCSAGGNNSSINYEGRGAVTLILPDVTEVHEGTFGQIHIENDDIFSLALREVHLPNATRIGENAFRSQQYLRKVHAPMVREVSADAFSDCLQLADVTMPQLEGAGDWCFASTSISQVPGSPQTIGSDAFWGCENLTDVNLTQTTSIGTGAIRNCDNLQSVTASLLTVVPLWAFTDNPSLTSLTFAQPITEWGAQVLNNVTTENITLTLHPEQKVLSGGEANANHSKWTPAADAPTVTFGLNQTFCGYTFKEIKRYGE